VEVVLQLLARHAGPWAFLLLLSCGVGMPPWSEEIVLLGCGHFVAQGDLSFLAANLWCLAGILGGDSILWGAGRFLGWRLARWRPFRRSMSPARVARFQRLFRRHGNKAVFAARFLPGFRVAAYFTAGHMGMPWWRFLALDGFGALLTVPLSIFLGRVFSENLGQALALVHRFRVPLGVLAALIVLLALRQARRRRLRRYHRILADRRRRRQAGRGGQEKAADEEAPRR